MIGKTADGRAEDIAQLERLKQAAPARYRAAVQKQIDRIQSGLQGERRAAHFLNREFGASDRVLLLHDLRLGLDGEIAQVDHLLIHRIQGTAWVLETKNYAGRLVCDDHGDWTVWRGRKPTPVPSPVNQARRQCELLRRWLESRGMRSIHTLVPVVLVSPTSSVDRRHLVPGAHVVKSDNFGSWFAGQADAMGLGKAFGLVGRHLFGGLSKDQMTELGRQLVREHQPASYDWRSILRLSEEAHREPAAAGRTECESDRPTVERALQLRQIATPYGMITVTRLADDRIAIRNERNQELIDRVRHACKQASGRWNPRFASWTVAEDAWPSIIAALD